MANSDSYDGTSLTQEAEDLKIFITPNVFRELEDLDDSDDFSPLDPEHLTLDETVFGNDSTVLESTFTTIPSSLTQSQNVSELENESSNSNNLNESNPDSSILESDSAAPFSPPIVTQSRVRSDSPKHTPVHFDLALEMTDSDSDDGYIFDYVKTKTVKKRLQGKSVGNEHVHDSADPDDLDFTQVPSFAHQSKSKADEKETICTSFSESSTGCRPKVNPSTVKKSKTKPLKASTDNPPQSRFHKSTEKELEDLQLDAKSERTHRQTKWGTTIFTDWCKFAGVDAEFEKLPADQLGTMLKQFYGEVRQCDGTPYSRPSLLCIRAAISRHLLGPPHNRNINIMSAPEFQAANSVISGTIKNAKKRGEDISNSHEAILDDDIKLMYSTHTLSNENPQSLQFKIFFEVSLHWGQRGREGLRNLKKNDIIFATDRNGKCYATLRHNPFEKNHSGLSHHESQHLQKMYETGADDCPVQSLRIYLDKLNKDGESFFQRPKTSGYRSSPTWYYKSALGVHNIGNMMARISEAAGLSRRYTNHCIRTTTLTALREDGDIAPIDIVSVTGHRCVPSVDSYSRTSDKTQHKMSLKLSSHIGKKTLEIDEENGQKSGEKLEKIAPKKLLVIEEEPSISPRTEKKSPLKSSTPLKIMPVRPSPRKTSRYESPNRLDDIPRRSPRLEKKRQESSTNLQPKQLQFTSDGRPNEKGQTIIIEGGNTVHIHYH